MEDNEDVGGGVMAENKYEKAFYDWVKLGDELMDGFDPDNWEDTFELYLAKSKEFEEAFSKADKWDTISEAMKKTVIDIRTQKGPTNPAQLAIHHIFTAYLEAVGEQVEVEE